MQDVDNQDHIPYGMLGNTATLDDAIKWIVKNELDSDPKTRSKEYVRKEVSAVLLIVITELFKISYEDLAALIFEEWKSVDDIGSRY